MYPRVGGVDFPVLDVLFVSLTYRGERRAPDYVGVTLISLLTPLRGRFILVSIH